MVGRIVASAAGRQGLEERFDPGPRRREVDGRRGRLDAGANRGGREERAQGGPDAAIVLGDLDLDGALAPIVGERKLDRGPQAIGQSMGSDFPEEAKDLLFAQRIFRHRAGHSALPKRDRLPGQQPDGLGGLGLHRFEKPIKPGHV